MPSFQVLRCVQCETFQVQQVTKSKKWKCKLCGLKQSTIKVFGEGTGAECRQHVQKLNRLRGELDHDSAQLNLRKASERASAVSEPVQRQREGVGLHSVQDNGADLTSEDDTTKPSRWSKFVQPLHTEEGTEISVGCGELSQDHVTGCGNGGVGRGEFSGAFTTDMAEYRKRKKEVQAKHRERKKSKASHPQTHQEKRSGFSTDRFGGPSQRNTNSLGRAEGNRLMLNRGSSSLFDSTCTSNEGQLDRPNNGITDSRTFHREILSLDQAEQTSISHSRVLTNETHPSLGQESFEFSDDFTLEDEDFYGDIPFDNSFNTYQQKSAYPKTKSVNSVQHNLNAFQSKSANVESNRYVEESQDTETNRQSAVGNHTNKQLNMNPAPKSKTPVSSNSKWANFIDEENESSEAESGDENCFLFASS